jgi:chemotaxis signal transduction protein
MIVGRLSEAPRKPVEDRKLIGFQVGEVLYGIDIMRVREIMNPTQLFQIPVVTPHVIGVTDHRKTIIPIVSLRQCFQLEPTEMNRKTKWILLRLGSKEIGLQVDRVTQVIKLSPDKKRKKCPLIEDENQLWIENVYADENNRLVFELDLETVVGQVGQLPDFDTIGMQNQ